MSVAGSPGTMPVAGIVRVYRVVAGIVIAVVVCTLLQRSGFCACPAGLGIGLLFLSRQFFIRQATALHSVSLVDNGIEIPGGCISGCGGWQDVDELYICRGVRWRGFAEMGNTRFIEPCVDLFCAGERGGQGEQERQVNDGALFHVFSLADDERGSTGRPGSWEKSRCDFKCVRYCN